MFNFVYSGFDAKIKINNNFYNINKNSLQPVDENFDHLTIFAPHNSEATFVPYTISKTECAIYKHSDLNANVYSIKPNYFLKQNGKSEIFKNEQISISFLTRGKCFLTIATSEQTYTEHFAELCVNPQQIITENTIVVYAKNILCDGYSVLVFNLSTHAFVYNSSVYEIKQNGNELCFVDYPVPTGAAKATIYNLTKFLATESYYVKLFNPQPTCDNAILLFYAIKTKDFNYAKTLLSPALAASATNEMLESFFAPYTDMYKSPFKSNCYVLVEHNTLRNVTFSLDGQFIDNFNIV